MSPKAESFDVRAPDGVRIRAHKVGSGPHRWLLVPGMGTPLLCWKHIFEAFADRMTIVTWDQRGCFDSDSPPRERLAFEYHVEDALAVLDGLGWDEPFVTGSWSMGVQVGLELFARRKQQVKALTLINGAYEHVLSTAYGSNATTPLLKAVLRTGVRASPLLMPLTRRLLASGAVGRFMDVTRTSTANAEFVTAVTRELARVDLGNYLAILLALDEHSAAPVLSHVKVPTLITAGAKDVATPPGVMQRLRERIPHAEYVTFERGTHYTPLEYPAELNAALERFFARVFGADWVASG
ncbi:MAG: alpha/beta hydrolase [Myxococcales bacterium]|nr:alpha/beta hydrolase [Myxococcales bacterium]MCB9578633.1 alpha/beta hydrolase [Polyangiaceae bacterium]